MTESMSVAIAAIRNFVYFTRNYPAYPKQMCEEIWGKGVDGNHFYSKLEGYDFDMCRFFLELSIGNQTKFAEWVIKNYDCGWNKHEHPELNQPEGKANTYILFGENAASWYSEEGIEGLLKHLHEDVFDIKKIYCRNEKEKLMYVSGVADGQGWDGCIEITEDDCKQIEHQVELWNESY